MDRRIFLALTAASGMSGAAKPSQLNGRWGLTVPGNDRRRAWWVEIKGAETPKPGGSFIGAPGGGLDEITDMKVIDGEAVWTFSRPARNNTKAWKGIYRAHVEGDKLVGKLEVEGQPAQTFTGERVPPFRREDPAQFSPGPAIELFNGKDLTGWKALRDNVPMLWKAEGGILTNGPGTSDIVTTDKFFNFRLHAEYRVGSGSNSGIGLRGRYEVQILEDHGKRPDSHGNGALYSRILPTSNASKPAGEWQTFDITLTGNIVTVVLNGQKIIDGKEIEGLTAIAIDPHESDPGPIVLQGDHGPVEFRKLTLTPLTRR